MPPVDFSSPTPVVADVQGAALEPNGSPPAGSLQQSGPLYGLAHGELSEGDAAELRALKQQVQARIGFQCDGYKEKCLRRRIVVRMRARGVHGFAAYAALLETDAQEYARLLDAVTINVSKFLRNADAWALLRSAVVPHLFARADHEIRIWSAGCAAGEEAYSLAMLMSEYAEEHAEDVRRVRIVATDIDTSTLAVARRGEYAEFAFAETPPELRERWFEGPQSNRVRAELRELVEFRPLDLMADPYPERQHLILCRNVVIYFERAVQDAVFRRFHGALAPGAFLLLGKVESLFGPVAGLYTTVSNRERLFRKP
jgi:chemotaxis methyl-accepting protein methylase